MVKTNLILSVLLFALFIVCGCAVSLENTKKLQPGMSIEEVRGLLGDPAKTSYSGGMYFFHYRLQYYMNSNYPYLAAFDSRKCLIVFGDDEKEIQRQTDQARAINEAVNGMKGTSLMPVQVEVKEKK